MWRWPIVEALAAYEAIVYQETLTAYRIADLRYLLIAPYSKKATAPSPPPLLKLGYGD